MLMKFQNVPYNTYHYTYSIYIYIYKLCIYIEKKYIYPEKVSTSDLTLPRTPVYPHAI